MKNDCFTKCKLALISSLMVLLASACSGGSSDENVLKINYLAVQIEEGDNWSIMDSDGKIVVKEEYAPSSEISNIGDGGAYWVKFGNKYTLFSIDSPKKPLINTEYDYVTSFVKGYAFASVIGEPIQVINEKGKIVKTLPTSISGVALSTSGLHQYADKEQKVGYLNEEGDIVIPAKYNNLSDFSDGIAAVKENESDNDWLIINKKGKVTGKINSSHYQCRPRSIKFGDGLLPINSLDEKEGMAVLDKKGNAVFKSNKYKRIYESIYINGLCIVEDKEGNPCVIDENGEIVIRPGKYKELYYLGDDMFLARKNKGSVVVIDKDDNILIDDKYDSALPFQIGKNLILRESPYYVVTDRNGNKIKNTEFEEISSHVWNMNTVFFIDIESAAKAIVENITPQGYAEFKGKKSAEELGKMYNLNPENIKRKYFDIPSFKADQWNVEVSVGFSDYVAKMKTHKEVVNDGWFAQERIVNDGMDWNEDAILKSIVLHLKVGKDVKTDDLINAIGQLLKDKGFKDYGDYPPVYEANNGDKYARVTFNYSLDDYTVTVYFEPEFPYSEAMVDND